MATLAWQRFRYIHPQPIYPGGYGGTFVQYPLATLKNANHAANMFLYADGTGMYTVYEYGTNRADLRGPVRCIKVE
jgi:hypothetical protein